MPFHDAGDVYKAPKSDVELVKAGGHTAKNIHALEEVFNQVVRPVAVLVQGTWVFAVDHGENDALPLGALNNRVRVVGLVSQKRLDHQSTEQLSDRLGVIDTSFQTGPCRGYARGASSFLLLPLNH